MKYRLEFSEAERDRARQTDIASFLIAQGEKVKRSGSEWEWNCGGEKITIRGCLWYNQYRQEGGNAIDFVKEYCQVDYPTAVRMLLGGSYFGIVTNTAGYDTPNYDTPKKREKSEPEKEFVLPERNRDMERVKKYLCDERCISRDVVRDFAARGLLYEDTQYHNAIFLGCDEDGTPRHVHRRAAYRGGTFKGTAEGSMIEHSFHHIGTSGKIYVFEAPIDMLSFITMYPDNWQEDSYIALCSVAPKALFHQLSEHDNINEVIFCLDNDEAGFMATERITAQLRDSGIDCKVSTLIPNGKDWNDDLCAMTQQQEAVLC